MQGRTWLKPWPPRPLILVMPPACGFTRNCAEISPFPASNFGSHKLIPATEIACGNAGLRLRVKLMYWVGSPVITLRATPRRLLACSSVEDLSLSLYPRTLSNRRDSRTPFGVRSSFSLKFLAGFPFFCYKFLSTSSIACSFELGFCRKRILCLFFRRILVPRVTLGRTRALAQALGNGFFFCGESLGAMYS